MTYDDFIKNWRPDEYEKQQNIEQILNECRGYSQPTPDYSNFGIMANTPGPTPDAFLIDDIIKKNNW